MKLQAIGAYIFGAVLFVAGFRELLVGGDSGELLVIAFLANIIGELAWKEHKRS